MSEVKFVLDRSDFEEQIMRTIQKAENTYKHKYNQQYGKSDQSNMTSNTIKTTLRVI